jgi:hypothetical protein
MMMPDVLVEVEDTAADSDVFSGTEIDQPAGDGYALYWVASTVNTATIEVPQFNHAPGKTALVRKRTDGIPSIEDDPCFVIPIRKGSRPIVSLGGTTGTVHHTLAVFYRRGK